MADARTPVSTFPAATSAPVPTATRWTKTGRRVGILTNAPNPIFKRAEPLGPASIYPAPIAVSVRSATKRQPLAAMVIESPVD